MTELIGEKKHRYIVAQAYKQLLSVDDDHVENGECSNNYTSQHCRPYIFILIIVMREKKKLMKISYDFVHSNKNIL